MGEIDLSDLEADGFTCIVGYRRFTIPYSRYVGKEKGPHRLMSTAVGFSHKHGWEVGDNEAECLWGRVRPLGKNRHPQKPPVQECSCGLHAYKTLQGALDYVASPSLVAGVIGWGVVFLDNHYWRAEKARVVCLAEPDEELIRAPLPSKGDVTVRWMEAAWSHALGASERYGVPVVPRDELESYTLNYGEAVG